MTGKADAERERDRYQPDGNGHAKPHVLPTQDLSSHLSRAIRQPGKFLEVVYCPNVAEKRESESPGFVETIPLIRLHESRDALLA
jgi:hypothetical protein